MSAKRKMGWLAVSLVLGCSPSGGGGATPMTTGDHMVDGTMIGMIDANGDGTMDGVGYDSNGDGTADEIDTDGDGIVDGEDNDGDGTITLWDDLDTGAVQPSDAEEALFVEDTDPDFDQQLDPSHPPDNVDPSTGEVTPPPMLPVYDASTFMPLNQGSQGSCAAFANAAAATIVRHEREGGAATSLWASPAFLYPFQVQATTGGTCGEGTFIHAGLDVLVMRGAATLAELPYRSGNMPMLCESSPMGATEEVYRIGSWEEVRPFDSATIREVLASGSPIVFGTPVTSGFFSWAGDAAQGVFDFGTDACTGQHCGGHAMALVGYDDERRAFRVLNSWGQDWGDRGYMWLTYDYFDRGRTDVYGYSITALPGTPSALGTPDAASFAATLVGAPVLRQVGSAHRLTARISLNEPLHLTSVQVTDSAGTMQSRTTNVWIAYGNVSVDHTAVPAAGAAMLHLEGTLRDGTAASADVMIEIPTEAADPNGAN